MKKLSTLFSLIALMFAFNVHAVITSAGSSNTVDNTGSVTKKDVIDITVKAGAALNVGDVVVPSLSTDDGVTVVKTADTNLAPLCVMNETLASGAIGTCRVFGYHSAVNLDVTGANVTAGQVLYMSGNTAGYAKGPVAASATQKQLGIALDTSSTSGTIEAIIQLL